MQHDRDAIVMTKEYFCRGADPSVVAFCFQLINLFLTFLQTSLQLAQLLAQRGSILQHTNDNDLSKLFRRSLLS